MSYSNVTKTERLYWVNKTYRKAGNGSPSTSTVYKSTTLSNVRSGTAVKDYKQKIADGQQAGSAYSLDASTLKVNEPGLATYSGHTDPAYGTIVGYAETFEGVHPVVPPLVSHNATSLVTADSIALSKVYKKIKSEQQSMNSPAVLAEFLDVLRQFGSPARSIIDLTNRRLNRLQLESRGLKGSTSFRKIRWSEIVASTYLEYSFGLAPLISDTRSAAEALARLHAEKEGLLRPRKRAVARGSDIAVSSYTPTPTRPANCSYIWVKPNVSKVTECRVQYIAGLESTLRADLGSNDRLLQLLGFNPENWVPAIWEAVPWSWLFDYFSNVQQILEASVTNTTDVKWLVKTVTYRTDYKQFYPVDAATTASTDKSAGRAGTVVSGHAGNVHQIRTTLTRTLPASLGVPALYFELPSSAKQLANMTAVLFARKPSASALWLT